MLFKSTYPVVGENIHRIRILNDLIRKFPEGFARHNARIVDQDIHSANVRLNTCGGLIDLLAIRNVDDIRLASQIVGGQNVDGRLKGCADENNILN